MPQILMKKPLDTIVHLNLQCRCYSYNSKRKKKYKTKNKDKLRTLKLVKMLPPIPVISGSLPPIDERTVNGNLANLEQQATEGFLKELVLATYSTDCKLAKSRDPTCTA